jgi:hypothetical protein
VAQASPLSSVHFIYFSSNFSADVPFKYVKVKKPGRRCGVSLVRRMEIKKITLFLFTFFVLISNASAQDTFVSIGSGGGFAGTATVYKVTPKGLIFKGEGIGDITFTLCGKIRKTRAKQIIGQVADQARAATEFQHPGNLYYFIGYTENEKQQTITWGDADHPISDEIKKLYEDVHATVSAIIYRPIQ